MNHLNHSLNTRWRHPGNKEYEIRYLAGKFGILRKVVSCIISEVGLNRELIEKNILSKLHEYKKLA